MHDEDHAWIFFIVKVNTKNLPECGKWRKEMKEKWEAWKETLEDSVVMSKREFLLTIAVCILGGIVYGMLTSPRKNMTVGSHNGNGSGNYTKEALEGEQSDCAE